MSSKKILVIDNYDSFTYNLVHLLQELGQQYEVIRNDKFNLEDVDQYSDILLSPGPGLPRDAGLLMDVVRTYGSSKRILGVCLGMQAIAEVYGGSLYNLEKPFHGVSSQLVTKAADRLFSEYPPSSKIGRYHSWAVRKEGLPDTLRITAEDEQGVVMAISHTEYDVKGIQFHPESVLSENGIIIIKNWLNL